jgi:hypothetical protein
MFDTLTEAEREALYRKLHDWAHHLFQVGHTLARVGLANHVLDGILWDERARYLDARNDLLELAEGLVA